MKVPRRRNIIDTLFIFFICFLSQFSLIGQTTTLEILNPSAIKLDPLHSKTKFIGNQSLLIPSYNLHLGAFCKLENNISDQTKFAVRLRLGEVQYVDQLEMKLPAYRLLDFEDFKLDQRDHSPR